MAFVEPRSPGDTVEIAPGVPMPRLGLGTYRADAGPDVEHEVQWGLKIGYRLIDTASLYGNEASIGDALRLSGIPRGDVFVTTKVWNSDQGYESTLAAFETSLDLLAMEYVDLYLVHWHVPALAAETWRAMEEILARGKTRAIGVCNYLIHHLEDMQGYATVPPAVDQVEFHPRLQQPDLQRYCEDHGITLQAWAPVMRGRVGSITELVEIGRRHGKTPAQVSIRWILQEGLTAIPKSVHRERIIENADVYDFALSEEEVAVIRSLDRGERIGSHPDTMGAGSWTRRLVRRS